MSATALPSALVLLLLLVSARVQGVVFSNDFCETQCASESDFIQPLPEDGPLNGSENRAYAWSIVALNQLVFNLGKLSPPSAARVCALVGSCLYEAAALNSNRFGSSTGNPFKLPLTGDDDTIANTMDGAAFWAVRSLFKGRDSFPTAIEQYENFSGETVDGLVPKIEFALNVPYPFLVNKFLWHLDDRSAAFIAGAVACDRVVKQFTEDGFNPDGTKVDGEDPTGYSPVNLPQQHAGITDCDNEIVDFNRWQPLCIPAANEDFGTTNCEPQEFLAPWAGRFSTFALEDGDETNGDSLVSPPPLEGSEELRAQTNAILDLSASLDDVKKIVAEYWADGPDSTAPPGHSWKIAGDAALLEGLSTLETARLLFIVGNAVNDAAVASWRTKTTFDFIRPLQLIQCGEYRGQTQLAWQGPYLGVGLTNLSEWRPFQATSFVTPPFAAYTSGHSTISAAAAEAMTLFFGDDAYKGPSCFRTPRGKSLFEPQSDAIPGLTDVPNSGPQTVGFVPAEDVVLCWDTFLNAAEEAGVSRFFGGIHVLADHDAGKEIGFAVGKAVFYKAQSLLRAYTNDYY